MSSINKQARLAGILYLSLLPLCFFGFPFGPSRIFIPENAAATANNVLASLIFFRISIVANLLGAIINALVALALYRLLKPAGKNMASLMVVFLLLSVPIGMFNEINHMAVLLLLSKAGYLAPFSTDQLQAMVLLFHDLHTYGLNIAMLFWGLWLFPMGYLVFKSGFLPKILGIILMLGCFGWLSEAFIAYFLPGSKIHIGMFTALGEIIFPVYLLIKGVNTGKWQKLADKIQSD